MKAERMLQSQGFGSRKECRAIILAGGLQVDGRLIEDPAAELPASGFRFEVFGEAWDFHPHTYVMLHKPAGYECSRKPTFHPSVFQLLPPQFAARDVQPIGRLDQDTTGLILLSDDGQFIHTWSSGKKNTPKAYLITTAAEITSQQIEHLLTGVQLHDEPHPVRAAACEALDSHVLRMVITEGKYHQVKRMLAAVHNHVVALHRERIGGLVLPADLLPGEWRWLSSTDLQVLPQY